MNSTVLRWIAATGALIASLTHLSLYFDGYRDIPIANVGTQFLLNAISGIAIAVALLASLFVSSLPRWTTKIAALIGVGWSGLSLVAYTLSHSNRGWMGYNDGPGFFEPAPQGAVTVFSEATVLVACLALAVLFSSRASRSNGDD